MGRVEFAALVDRIHHTPGTWNLRQCDDRSCALLWLDPLPPEDGTAYDGYYTHQQTEPPRALSGMRQLVRTAYLNRYWGYDNSPVVRTARLLASAARLSPRWRSYLDSTVMWLHSRPSGRLLEVGCGSGQLMLLMQASGWIVEGVDSDAGSVAVARAKGLDVVIGGVEAKRDAIACYDAIVMSHVVEHLYDPESVLRQCHRLLAPGGTIVLLTPNGDSLGRRLFGRHWLHLDPPRHVQIFRDANLADMARRAGFSDVVTQFTVRDSDNTLGASYRLLSEGSYSLGTLTWWQRWVGRALLWAEVAITLKCPRLAEEIVVSGTKLETMQS